MSVGRILKRSGLGYVALAAIGFLAVTVRAGPGPVGSTSPAPAPFELRRTIVDQRPAVGATTRSNVHGRLEAIAVEELATLELAYCGPDPILVTVDGSTVDAAVAGERLHAALHAPIAPGQRFELGIIAVGDADSAAFDLFC